MSLYFFRIRSGRYSGTEDRGTELADRDAAWSALTKSCGDMVGGISRKLTQNAEWQMEILDESKSPIFRIRLIAETLDDPAPKGCVGAKSEPVFRKDDAQTER